MRIEKTALPTPFLGPSPPLLDNFLTISLIFLFSFFFYSFLTHSHNIAAIELFRYTYHLLGQGQKNAGNKSELGFYDASVISITTSDLHYLPDNRNKPESHRRGWHLYFGASA